MAAKNDFLSLTPERVHQFLTEWFAMSHPTAVAFKEVTEPVADQYANYSVVYEVIFEPSSLDQARVELWLTKEGNVALGFERRKRIAERLGVKSGGDRFAAGHEPHRMRESDLLTILELIATGQIAIASSVIPFFGLISTRAVASHDVLKQLNSKGHSPLNWLEGVSQAEFSNGEHLLRFRPWKQPA